MGNGKQRHICYRDSKLTFLLRVIYILWILYATWGVEKNISLGWGFFYSKKLNLGTLIICFNIGQVEECLKNIFLLIVDLLLLTEDK